MNKENRIIDWLLKGDVSIQYQVHRDLLCSSVAKQKHLQKRIKTEGWGARFLKRQNDDGHWGMTFYQPKWTSTHYTLLDLKNLGIPPTNRQARRAIQMIFDEVIGSDGGVNYLRSPKAKEKDSDVCVNGMFVNFASYFGMTNPQLYGIIDLLLSLQVKNGGWNCEWFHGATHSSLHTTISVLEGLLEFRRAENDYRKKEIQKAEKRAIEFILEHQLCKSHRTGAIIDKKMLMLSYPCRWRYDILRALDYFQAGRIPFDERMRFAVEVLLKKQRRDGKWPVQNKHPGQVHFDMEKAGLPSRWNTLRALRVLKHFRIKHVLFSNPSS